MARIRVITENAFDHLGFDDKDLCDLIDLAETREYWEKALTFVVSLKDRDKVELSQGQITWATDILDQLDDLRRRGKI